METPNDRYGRKRRCTDSFRSADSSKVVCVSSDFLRMPEVVVDNILQYLDDPSLLTARLVCQSWNAQVTSRNTLWKKRCERKRHFLFDMTTDPVNKFQTYLSYHRVYYRMRTGQAFQIEEHTQALDCYLTGKETLPEEWDPRFLDHFNSHGKISVLDSFKVVLDFPLVDSLMMMDLRTQQILWQTDFIRMDLMDTRHSSPYVVCVSNPGKNVVLYSLEGDRGPTINCHGLFDPFCRFDIHPSGRFILFGGRAWLGEQEYWALHLLDVEEQTVTELKLNGPDPSQRGLGQLFRVGFLAEDTLGEGQLAVGASTTTEFKVAAVIDTRGKVLHQTCLETHISAQMFNILWCDEPFSDSHDMSFVMQGDDDDSFEKYRVLCEDSRVHFKLDWSTPIYEGYHECLQLVFGDQFVVGKCYHTMKIFRLASGQLVAEMPRVFHRFKRMYLPDQKSLSFQCQALKTLQEVFEHKSPDFKKYERKVRFSNLQWLHGLSAANTKPDVPICIRFDKEKAYRCMRWRHDVWMSQGDITGQRDDITWQRDDIMK